MNLNEQKHPFYFEYFNNRKSDWMFESGIINDEPAKEILLRYVREFPYVRNITLDHLPVSDY